MKKILLILLTLLSINLFSQKEISLDNSLTGLWTTSKSTQFGFNFVGNNSLDWNKKLGFDLTTNYQARFSPTINDNEFIQRVNIGHSEELWDLFTTYQFNYSLIRNINADNWIGAGGGLKKKFSWGKLSFSYAALYDHTQYSDGLVSETMRHSFRPKVKVENKIMSISCEYFYQPSMKDFSDYIIIGNTKLSILPQNKINFVVQDVLNFRSVSDVKTIHALTFGLNYKFSKTF